MTAGTTVFDLPQSTVLPAFDDTHTHLIFAGHSAHDVPVHQARTIAEFLDLIRQRAATTPEGRWIRTTTNWQELNLAERRMPTAAELDQAADRHPVLVKRGGHNDVVNTYALRLAGITDHAPDPAGGVIGRDADGRLNGRLIDNALGLVERLVPTQDRALRIAGLRLASGQYAAAGVGTVRDCAVSLDDYSVLLAAREAGALSARVRALISAIGLSSAAEVEDLLDAMEDWRYDADPWLRVWGVKFVLDGGLEAGATEEPYACDHAFSGTLTWEPDALAEAVEAVVRRGWRVGTHAYGDRAVRILLDVYERVLRNSPGLRSFDGGSPRGLSSGQLRGYVAAEQSDQLGEEGVEFAADLGDLRVVVAGEQQAGLVDGEFGVAVGVVVEQGPQWRVQHDGWIVAEHAFRDGVVAHQVLGGLPEGRRSGHGGGDVTAVVAHEAVRGVDLGQFERGLPGGHLEEAGEIDLRNEGFVVVAGCVVWAGERHNKPPGGVVDDRAARGHGCACSLPERTGSTSWMSRVMDGRLRLTLLSGLRRKTRRRVATSRPPNVLSGGQPFIAQIGPPMEMSMFRPRRLCQSSWPPAVAIARSRSSSLMGRSFPGRFRRESSIRCPCGGGARGR
ncbi:hypothetical protein P3T39_004268 [Kitasatospora sp. GP82]|nr:hypothetical protein [Kitasatospora sp. GP82]